MISYTAFLACVTCTANRKDPACLNIHEGISCFQFLMPSQLLLNSFHLQGRQRKGTGQDCQKLPRSGDPAPCPASSPEAPPPTPLLPTRPCPHRASFPRGPAPPSPFPPEVRRLLHLSPQGPARCLFFSIPSPPSVTLKAGKGGRAKVGRAMAPWSPLFWHSWNMFSDDDPGAPLHQSPC